MTSPLDDIANDLALWIDQTSSQIALAFAPHGAPFAAELSNEQKLAYYRSQMFNPDGTPNPAGREAEFQRLGVTGFSMVYKTLVKAYPDLRIPAPPEIAVPQQWPHQGPPGPGAPGPQPGPPGAPGGPAPPPPGGGPPGPPTLPPRPPILPPRR
jgi:hypothetical protein